LTLPELSPAARIRVRNLQRGIRVDVAQLNDFGERALKRCFNLRKHDRTDLARASEIHVLLVSDRRISELHRRFMRIDGPTDVITFQHGEIFISVETAKRQASEHRTTLMHELQLYIVHGLLHLAGYDDRDTRRAEEMNRIQQDVLAEIGDG
jgi:probable rRNA maturation factor